MTHFFRKFWENSNKLDCLLEIFHDCCRITHCYSVCATCFSSTLQDLFSHGNHECLNKVDTWCSNINSRNLIPLWPWMTDNDDLQCQRQLSISKLSLHCYRINQNFLHEIRVWKLKEMTQNTIFFNFYNSILLISTSLKTIINHWTWNTIYFCGNFMAEKLKCFAR